MSKRGERAIFIGRQDQSRFEQRLKAVADAEDELFLGAKLMHDVAEKHAELIGEDLARGDVVAVGEAARDDEHLKLVQQLRAFAQAVDVDALGRGAGLDERELGLAVAVGARRPQD